MAEQMRRSWPFELCGEATRRRYSHPLGPTQDVRIQSALLNRPVRVQSQMNGSEQAAAVVVEARSV